MSQPSSTQYSASSLSPSSRLANSITLRQFLSNDRTPTPSAGRRRQNSHLTSSLFQGSSTGVSFAPATPPTNCSGQPCKLGESFTAQWPISNLRALKDQIEGETEGHWGRTSESMPEALQRGLAVGRGCFKLDLARASSTTSSNEEDGDAEQDASGEGRRNCLSLYIAAISLDGSPYDINYAANIFVGITPLRIPTGSRYAETRYLWQGAVEYDFSPDAEYCEVELPKLSELLDMPDLRADDGFALCVNIASPQLEQPTFHLPSHINVPRSTIEGLTSLIDSTSGDVKFVCLEHSVPDSNETDGEDSDDGSSSRPRALSRKRVLYAHSEIVKAACDFFHDLLTGDFQEAERVRRGDSRRTTIVIDDAGFQTVYWLLRFIYTNELSFAQEEDVRSLMDQLQIDRKEINRVLTTSPMYGPSEWEYRRLIRRGEDAEDFEGFDSRTVQSVSSTGTHRSTMSPTPVKSASQTLRAAPLPPHSHKPAATSSARPPRTASISSTPGARSRPGLKTQTTPAAPKAGNTTAIPSSSSPKGASRPGYNPRPSDPHAHPCAPPAPASALNIYMLSHRYRLEVLEGLAKDRIIEQMTPENCIPMLLATYQYDTLHAQILDYVTANWSSVQRDEEFLRCIQEVSAGIWGEAGGLVLHGLFQRL